MNLRLNFANDSAIKKNNIEKFAIIFLISFAIIQYILILRHKSPNLSDSYFYKHTYYQFQGNNFIDSYNKVIVHVDLTNADTITRNIFNDLESYKYSYSFFSKRLFYPFVAYLLNIILNNEYLAFLIPVFLSYLGIIVLIYYFSKQYLQSFFAVMTTALFLSFYPFLDWSTYFLTDVIGTLFWLLNLLFAYKFLTQNNFKWLIWYILLFGVSLFNREQNLLFFPLFIIFYFLLLIRNSSERYKSRTTKLIWISAILVTSYLIFSSFFLEKSILDNIHYIQNNYVQNNIQFTFQQTLRHLVISLKISLGVLFVDLTRHHWWFAFTLISVFGIIKTTLARNDKNPVNLLILSSGLASFLFILWPFLSYRFIFPTVFSVAYFFSKFIQESYYKEVNLGNLKKAE